jgi:hypothetical protein
MARITLAGGAYTARSLTAACQRQVNLYGEATPDVTTEGTPRKMTLYPTPGLVALASPPTAGRARALYRASNNQLYAVVGNTFYVVSAAWAYTALGTLAGGISTPVSMADNGTTLVAVDGTGAGYTVVLASNSFGTISTPGFYGGDRVDFIDTFFVLNKPGTGQFYSSNSNAITFDPLYFATKIGYADLLATIIVMHREIWLIGELTTEVWVNSGAATFPFEILNGAFIQHGCAAKYSVATMGDSTFWVSKDLQGQGVILKGSGYQSTRVSTHAIETALGKYATISDAVAFCYQQEGHQFYVLTFPTADKTWVLDLVTGEWHERTWIDGDGVEHRHRAACAAFTYGVNVVADWETGRLYALDLNAYTDAGTPIVRRRGFPHMIQNGQRVIYTQLIADMETGTASGTSWQGDIPVALGVDGFGDTALQPDGVVAVYADPSVLTDASVGSLLTDDFLPSVLIDDGGYAGVDPSYLAVSSGITGVVATLGPNLYLRWSDDRGATWSNPVANSFGTSGDFINSLQFQRLGMARDRVFELFWSSANRTALGGAWIETIRCKS